MYKYVKRVLDIIISVTALVILSPILLIVSILIKGDSKGPVIFKQERLGLNKKVFKMYKFRTMQDNSEFSGTGVYSDNSDNRITKMGKFLRKTSIDELPQFVNILIGDMSIIGPRPPLTYHPFTIDKYTDYQLRIFEVRPGVTGWAQVNGRREVLWSRRFELNVWYVDNMSLLLDIKIFFMSIFKVAVNEKNENAFNTVDSMNENESEEETVNENEYINK